MTKISIPPAALEAGARALARGIETEGYWPYYKNDARAAFLAIVEAWPGMVNGSTRWPHRREIILPLTEKTDDKA